jgi:hypothetical protein
MSLLPENLRARVTLSYVSVVAVLLVLVFGAASVTLFWQFRKQLDRFAAE